MNEILAYLERCKDQAYSDRFRHSANYLMSIPLDGHEKEHAAAIRDCEIVEELIQLLAEYPASDDTAIKREENKTAAPVVQERQHRESTQYAMTNMEIAEATVFKKRLETYIQDYGCPMKSSSCNCSTNHE